MTSSSAEEVNASNEEKKIMAHKGKGSCGSKGKGGKKGYR